MSEVALPFLPNTYSVLPPPLPFAEVAYIAPIRKWRLLRAYTFPLPTGERVTVPINFEYDGASIPKNLWSTIGPHELSMEAPLLHDWLYIHDGQDVPGLGRKVTKGEADAFFRAVMERQRVPDLYVDLAYNAVRHWGGLKMRIFSLIQKFKFLNSGQIAPALTALSISIAGKPILQLVFVLAMEWLRHCTIKRQDANNQISEAQSRSVGLRRRFWQNIMKQTN